jgi:1,4-alpha-glucan branching enzyme
VLQILLLAWEYPPMLVGGLGRHVYELSKAVAAKGHTVHVITTHVDDFKFYEQINHVHVHRVKSHYDNRADFYTWIDGLNKAIVQYAQVLCKEVSFDLIHAHDWLVCSAATAIKRQEHIPLLTTIHATEHGRNNGIHTSLQYEIHMTEKELVKESDVLIVCSTYMKHEIELILDASPSKIAIFPNGIDTNFFKLSMGQSVRNTYALQDRIIVFSIGRIVNEKGFQTVIDAAPELSKRYSCLMFIVAGKGPMLDYYRSVVTERGLGHVISFVGHISEEEQRAFLQESDIVLVPSLYEPFGIVALEGMLAAKPTIVSDVGGLSEIVIHSENGFKMHPGDVGSLIEQIERIVTNPKEATRIAENGREYVLQKYNWTTIAENTIRVYRGAVHHSKSGG